MKTLKTIISCCILLIGINTADAQIGKLKSLAKSATTDKKASESPEKPKAEAKVEKSEQQTEVKQEKPEQQQTSSQKQQKDADGYVINDPEAAELFKGKDVYQTSDVALYNHLLDVSECKMAGVVVNKTDDSLLLFIVAQKRYGGVYAKRVSFSHISDKYYQFSNYYATIQTDGSVLVFNSIGAELISKDENEIKNATKASLQKKAEEPLAEIKKAKEEKNAGKKIQENETFFKSGGVSAVKKDPALETQFLKVLNQENSYPTVAEKDRVSYKKTLLIFTDWTIEKNDLGIPLKMVYAAWAIGSYTADKKCFFQKVYMKKDYLGGGKYGEVKYDESQKPSIGSCDIIK
jgi:hypothetical protein